MIDFSQKDGKLIFDVRVVPRASKTEIVGEYAGALKVKLTSPPVDGAANKELIKLFSKEFGILRGDVNILSGFTSKTKKISLAGVGAEILREF